MNHHTSAAGTAGDTADTRVGTAPWVQRTSGRLTAAERRALLRPLARTHAQNAVGRLRLAVGLHPGRNAYVAAARPRTSHQRAHPSRRGTRP